MSEYTPSKLDPSFFTNLLTDPKRKLSGKERRRAARGRDKIVQVHRTPPKQQSVRLVEKLSSLSASGLVRTIQRCARRAASAKYLLADLHKDSVFRSALEAQQKNNLVAFVAATTELQNRGTHA